MAKQTKPKEPKKPAKKEPELPILYEKISLERAKELGEQLAKFCQDNNLLVDIAGKKYMQVEGWQFIGTQLGLTDIVKYCDKAEDAGEKEIKYKAVVEIINQNGTVISKGFAFASNKERKKTSFEEYAIASMAQTRAVGKAYRNFLAWIVKMTGYEPTPVEEVDKEQMETDLSKLKQKVVKALHERGITESENMIRVIQETIGKATIETADEAYKILKSLED